MFPYQLRPGITDVLAQTNHTWVAETGGKLLDVNPYTGHVEHTDPLGHVTPVAPCGRRWPDLGRARALSRACR